MTQLLKKTLQEDIKTILKGFQNAEKGGFIYDSLLRWCDVVEETLNHTEIGLNAEYGEMWQHIQDFRRVKK